MEINMEQDQHFLLLNLPTEIIEKILLYLRLPDRKNVRLMCKRLYNLCNSARFCKDEKFVWSDFFMHRGDMLSDLYDSTRCHFNLVIRLKKLRAHKVLRFFEKQGKKIHSLHLEKCTTSTGLLNELILHCEELSSLSLLPRYSGHHSDVTADAELNSLTLEPDEVTRPKVEHLKLLLPEFEPWKFFHRISSIFPHVRSLDIRIRKSSRTKLKTVVECSNFFDDLIRFGCNLESFSSNIPLNQLFIRGPQFFDALPNLKDLSIDFGGDKEPSQQEDWCSYFQNISTIEFNMLRSLRTPANWLPLLNSTELNHLTLNLKGVLILNWKIFKALLSSRLKIIHFHADTISVPSTENLDVCLKYNETVTDLTLSARIKVPPLRLFLSNFHGLVHLCLSHSIKDEIIQRIFQYQENLRSLSLKCCCKLNVDGFCGTEFDRPRYSIMNLSKLEHLEIEEILVSILESSDFKRVFNFPQLKYLHISAFDYRRAGCHPKIPLDLLEPLTNLEAVFFEDDAMPSSGRLELLFTKLKHLNYLRFSLDTGVCDNCVTFINTKHIPIELAIYKCLYSLGQAHYDYLLDRLVFANCDLEKTLLSPKISSFEIEWIQIPKRS